eukprot:m.1294887 g.1294887  ORF g.1294887 m.1294887 type:complete len:211 (+) comp24789_c2_seq19:2874-3506(+)
MASLGHFSGTACTFPIVVGTFSMAPGTVSTIVWGHFPRVVLLLPQYSAYSPQFHAHFQRVFSCFHSGYVLLLGVAQVQLLDDDDADAWVTTKPTHSLSGTSFGRLVAKSPATEQTIGQERSRQQTEAVQMDPAKLQVPSVLTRNIFLDADACAKCALPFIYNSHKQYCRTCTKIFCAACSSKRCCVAEFGFDIPIPLCDTCFRQRDGKQH